MPISNSPLKGVTHVPQFDDLSHWCVEALNQDLEDETLIARYTQRYREWIESTQLNTVDGLCQFPYASYANGTTEAFDKFYIKHRGRRVRVLPDEYSYHLRFVGAEPITNWSTLDSNDCLIISAPYSATGGNHPMLDQILSICDHLGVPVLIDAAYYGLGAGIHLPLEHPCVEDVAFSLSKTFGASKWRIGVRFSRTNEDSLATLNLPENSYVNRFGAQLGLILMREYGPDYLWTEYRSRQLALCEELNLKPSNSVIFALGARVLNDLPDESGRWCLSRYLDGTPLP